MTRKLPEYRQENDDNNFEYYLDSGKVKSSAQKPAILLIGGAEGGSVGEDAASQWFLQQANYGDYLVLRCGGIGRQAQWITDNYRDLINSAAELSIDSREAANNPEVVQYIKDADALYFAGGDQHKYETYWEGTATEDAINYLINQKKVPVAGTSAGMAILGDYYYSPAHRGLLSSEILNDPFHQNTQNIYRSNFIRATFLQRVITDTHLDRCNDNHPETRYGRIFGLMARVALDEQPVYGIGLEEGAFVAIGENGIAKVFGNADDEGQDAYFLQTTGAKPEQIKPGLPLIWDNDRTAVKAYRIQGIPSGSGTFDLNNWRSASGGTWEYWHTTGGDSGFCREQIDNE